MPVPAVPAACSTPDADTSNISRRIPTATAGSAAPGCRAPSASRKPRRPPPNYRRYWAGAVARAGNAVVGYVRRRLPP